MIQAKTRNYILYGLALLFGASFFSFEFFPNFSEDYYIAEKQAKEAKRINAIALSKVKEYARGTQVYRDYIKANNQKKEVFKHYNSVIEEEKVFGFNSFQLFWERFTFTSMIFIYATYNLFRSFYLESKNIGSKLMHFFVINFCVFYFFWIFQKFQDFSKITYYLVTFISSIAVFTMIYLMTKYRDRYINKLKETISRLVAFSFLHTKQEKKQEMLQMFRDLSKED